VGVHSGSGHWTGESWADRNMWRKTCPSVATSSQIPLRLESNLASAVSESPGHWHGLPPQSFASGSCAITWFGFQSAVTQVSFVIPFCWHATCDWPIHRQKGSYEKHAFFWETHLRLVPSLRISGAVPLLPLQCVTTTSPANADWYLVIDVSEQLVASILFYYHEGSKPFDTNITDCQ
jgi:hypothetical protein